MKSHEREEARRLRREGVSVAEISERLNIPTSTLWKCLRDIELTPEQKKALRQKRNEAAAAVVRKDDLREEARRLRSQGESVKEIARQINASVSSVSVWVRDIQLTDEQIAALKQRNPTHFGRWKGSETNRKKYHNLRLQFQEEGRAKARERDPLHIAGCMLYWAEGSKHTSDLRFSNSDPEMIAFFMRFLRESLKVKDDEITMRIYCYTNNGLSVEEIEQYWLDITKLPRSALRKGSVNLQPVSSKQKGRKLIYGVAHLGCSRVNYLQHVYGAIQEYIGVDKPEWLG
jgi:transposase